MGWADKFTRADRFFLWRTTQVLDDEPPTAGVRVRRRPSRPLSPAREAIAFITGSRSSR